MTNDIHPLYYAWEHRLPIYAGILAIVTAAVKTAPVPTPTSRPTYTWFYDFTHQFFNVTNTRLNSAPIITPPMNDPNATPAKSPTEA